MSQALVLGNGESRSGHDLHDLKDRYVLIGCNAIHRDIKVDHIVCCDRRMGDEVLENLEANDSMLYVRPDWYHYFRKINKRKNTQIVPELPYIGSTKADHPDHWGSGGYAVLLAATLFDSVTLLGFDLYPVNNRVNNVYKGTQHYAKPDGQAVDYSFWIYQIAKVFEHFPHVKFTVLNNPDWIMPDSWAKSNVCFENLSYLTVDL